MADLLTLAEAKLYLRIPTATTTYDTLISALVTSISRRIERDCQRVFGATDYVEVQNTGTRQQRAQVRNKPIIRINSVRWGYATAVQLNYTGNAPYAAAGITPDYSTRQVTLQTTSTSGTVTSTVNLTDSAYTMCSQVVTAINAVTGFSAQLMGNVDIPAKWLYPNPGITLKGGNATYTQGFGFPSVDMFTYIIDPIVGTIGFQPLTSMDYFFSPDALAVTPISWPGMYQGLMIDYRGGYETIPADITLLAQQVLKEAFDITSRSMGLQSESLDDYSYTVIDPIISRAYYADLLAPYRTIALAGGMG